MLRILSLTCAVFLLAASTAGAQTAPAPTTSAAATSAVVGVVSNASQGPVAGASVELLGSNVDRTASTDAAGKFAFSDVAAGSYSIKTLAKGFIVSTSAPFNVAAGERVELAVSLQQATTTELKEIGSVRINGATSLNTTSAPTVVITRRQFISKGQVLVQQALEQTPGVTIEHYNGGLGSVAVLTIRGAGAFATGTSNTGYEVLVLQDGEPLRNGQYGDFDLSTLTPSIYQRVEVLKGVGGSSIFGANTIGGTLNLVTRDPMKKEGGEFIGSVGGFGTTDYNFSETDTIGKLGYIFNVHRLNSPGPIDGNLQADFVNQCSFTPGVCVIAHPTQSFDLKSALVKLRWDFAPGTFVTLTGTTESDMRDQAGLQSNPTSTGGSKVDPLGYPYYFGYPADNVGNNQPKVSLDFHTPLGGGDLIFRTYGGELQRVDNDLNAINPPGFTNTYEDRSVDHLYGDELQWTKLFGKHTITLGAGGNSDNFFDAGGNLPAPQTFAQLHVNASGTQIERSFLLRDVVDASPRVRLDFAGYYSSYDTLNVKRFDPRFGLVYRPNSQTAYHLSAGSGFAPPRLNDIYQSFDRNIFDANYDPRCDSNNPGAPFNINGGFCAGSVGNPNLKAESAFGYDLGFEKLFTRDGRGRFDIDLYRTNLFGHIFTADIPTAAGTTFNDGVTTPPTPKPPTQMPFVSTPINLAAAVYTGFELSGGFPINRNFALSAYYDTQAAYPMNLDVATQNLAQTLVNNQQFSGVPIHKLGYSLGYQNAAGASAFFSGDYQGQNNAFNVPPFWLHNAGLTLPLQNEDQLHITWQNIFNKNSGIWSFFGSGQPYPGFSGPYSTSTHPSNPHMIMITLDHRWGSLRNP